MTLGGLFSAVALSDAVAFRDVSVVAVDSVVADVAVAVAGVSARIRM